MKAIEEEYKAVKKDAGLIDVSTIGKIQIKGKDSFKFIQNLVTADINSLNNNQGVCTLMCYPDGTVVDTLVVYKFEDNEYLINIHSGNADKIFKWMINRKRYHDISIINLTDKLYHIALQGPKSVSIMQQATNEDFTDMNYLDIRKDVSIGKKISFISKWGYNGDTCFEIFTLRENAKAVIKEVLDSGIKEGIKSIGIETRDALRYETNFPLFGNELPGDINPFEAGFDAYIKLDKDDFVGKKALIKQNKTGLKRKVVSFQVDSKTKIPGAGASIMANDKKIGVVAIGHLSPKSKKASGFAIVDYEYSGNGTRVYIDNIDEVMEAKITSFKSYKKRNKCM
ncbi:MAG: aminomethyltransferase family protein [Clostridiaceae bacterium]